MTSQAGRQTIIIHLLRNIFRIKANYGIKFGQLTKHNAKNTFHHKLCRKQGRETSSKTSFCF